MRPPGNVTSNVPTAEGWNEVNVIVPDVALFAGDATVSPHEALVFPRMASTKTPPPCPTVNVPGVSAWELLGFTYT